MKMQQMMEYLLAKIDATLKEMLTKINANQEKIDACIAEMGVWQKETMACQEAMDACLESKEPTSLEVESKAEHEEVPMEGAAVKTFTALKKRNGTGI
jgi:hypothetical protein